MEIFQKKASFILLPPLCITYTWTLNAPNLIGSPSTSSEVYTCLWTQPHLLPVRQLNFSPITANQNVLHYNHSFCITRMHSRRMRTVRSSSRPSRGWGCVLSFPACTEASFPGGAPFPACTEASFRGGGCSFPACTEASFPGGSASFPACTEADPPVDRHMPVKT